MIYQMKKALICKGKLIAVKSIHVIVMNIPLGDLTHQTTPYQGFKIKMFYPTIVLYRGGQGKEGEHKLPKT